MSLGDLPSSEEEQVGDLQHPSGPEKRDSVSYSSRSHCVGLGVGHLHLFRDVQVGNAPFQPMLELPVWPLRDNLWQSR